MLALANSSAPAPNRGFSSGASALGRFASRPGVPAAAASAVNPASLRNRLRSSIAPRFYTAPVCLAIVSRALDTGVTLATGGAETPRLFGASAARRMGGLEWVEHCCSPASKRCPMTHRSLLLLVSLALVATLALAPLSADAAGVPCPALPTSAISATTITSATIVAAAGTAPEHCLVIGHVDTEINFELRLPTTTWNGKFYHAGGGGFVGSIPRSPGALARGYAVIGTDTGHVGDGPFFPALDGSWALNNLVRQVNFGHRAVHVVTAAGKKILHAFYGQTERLAYFEGCSNGGRQAMQEAERYPTDFDGIIAGAPALDWVGTMTRFVLNEQAGNAASLPLAKVALLAGAVLAECDAKDGLMDGLISDPRRCRFDPTKLQCTAGDAPTCLTAGEGGTGERNYPGATAPRRRRHVGGPPADG